MDDRNTAPSRPTAPAELDRRAAVSAGAKTLLGLSMASYLAGCTGSRSQHAASAPPRTSTEDLVAKWGQRGGSGSYATLNSPAPATSWTPPGDQSAWRATPVRLRNAWASEGVVPRLMSRMQPVNRITLHHSGMTPFTSTGERQVAARLDLIRRAHRNRNFGDIGYHYLVDPAGRIWEGRQLTWQGAHVARQNQGNLGICCLGNFEEQSPTDAQLSAVEAFTISQMHRFNVPVNRIYTHRELAPTACPGRNLQPRLLAMRRSGGSLAQA